MQLDNIIIATFKLSVSYSHTENILHQNIEFQLHNWTNDGHSWISLTHPCPSAYKQNNSGFADNVVYWNKIPT